MRCVIFISTLLLLSSCSTLINGSKQNISITSNVDSSLVKINEEAVGYTPLNTKIARKGRHVVKIEKDGYETATVQLQKKISKIHYLNFVPSLLIGYLTLNKAREDQFLNSSGMDWIIASGATFVSYFVVNIPAYFIRANTQHEKIVEANLFKLPVIVDSDLSAIIVTTNANFNIFPGTIVGSHYFGKRKISDILWQSTINVKSEEFVVMANNLLSKYGYNVPGLRNTKDFMIPINHSDLELKAYVKHIKFDINQNQDFFGNILVWNSCVMEIEWELVNKKNQNILFKTTYIGSTPISREGQQAIILKTFTNSFYQLLKNDEFKKHVLIKKHNNSLVSIESYPIKLMKPKTMIPVTEAIKPVVTIKTAYNHGSGFLISEDGYILTNHHVIDGFEQVEVFLSNGFSFFGKIVKYDNTNDLALIKIEGKGFPYLYLGNSDEILLGEDVHAIGAPTDVKLGQTITKGIISGTRMIDSKKVIQTDVSISPGNSGGPLINKNGHVIGIISSKMIGKGIEGVGFAIPINTATLNLNLELQE
jgi:serine protease Do